jgi:hypothetical protein
MTEAYQALRPFLFAGRQYERGDPVRRSTILDVSPAKEGTLLRTRFIGLPPEQHVARKTKAELVDLARTLDLKVDASWRKQELVEVVERALTPVA